jgi:hypothetical protein
MKCQAVKESIIAQAGRPSLSPEVESHLWGCPDCSQVYLEQQALWRAMDAWETPDVSAGFDRRLFARIGRASPWAPFDWLLRLFRPLQPAFPAALAGVVLLAALVVQQDRQLPVEDPAAAVQTLEREDVRQIETALDDIQMLSEFEFVAAEGEEGKS